LTFVPGSCCKNGLKLKLGGQPFQVLALLLERPGELMTREEIQKRLWPADTFVDFDHNLNTAINKIREALGDSAENPRFVETLPRRGYRFIAPVEVGAPLVPALSPDNAVPVPAVHQQGVPPAGTVREPHLRTRRGLRLVAMLAMLVVGAAIARYAWERSRPKPELIQLQLTTNSSELAVTASAISPDGRYLAYADDSGIHLKVVDTAEMHDLPTPAGSRVSSLAWFAEGNKLLASGEAAEPRGFSLWTVSILGGAPQKLRDNAWDGSVFQDGAGIVFVSSKGKEIWQMGPAGEDAWKLITASEGESFAVPVVAKGRLWYKKHFGNVSTGLPAYKIESRDLKGGPPALLLSASGEESPAVLLPNGRLIYSQHERPDLYQGGSVWEIQADPRTGLPRSEPRRIAGWPDFDVAGLSATADGRRLAFLKEHLNVSSVDVGDMEGDGLGIVNPNRLTLSDSSDHAYAWTPDSKSVLFDSNRNGTWDVFKQAIDQRTAVKLASPGGRPAMSPDGTSVLYLTSLARGSAFQQGNRIMRVALPGGPPQSLGEIQNNFGLIRCARAANACVVSDSGTKERVFYALDPAKGKGRELLRTGPALTPAEDGGWDLSPDGSTLAFFEADPQRQGFQIQVRRLAGGARRELDIGGPLHVGRWAYIRWAADGRGWYVSTKTYTYAGTWTLLKVDLTGRARQLIQGPRWSDPIPSPDGRHVAMMGWVPASNVWMLENF
jgi:DNA-binding winged helix-turn-helix (wHTH) protein/Tol biopolymer transport system component